MLDEFKQINLQNLRVQSTLKAASALVRFDINFGLDIDGAFHELAMSVIIANFKK